MKYINIETQTLLSAIEELFDRKINEVLGTNKTEEYLGVNEVCAIFNVSRVTVYDWIAKGKIRYSKIGNKYTFKRLYINTLKSFNEGNNLGRMKFI